MAKLTRKQKVFVEEYAVDFNATRAAKEAKYSEKNAGKIGPALTQKPHVKEAIDRALELRAARARVRGDKIVDELKRLAFSDIGDFAEWDDSRLVIKDSKSLRTRLSRAILEVKESAGSPKPSIKLHPKIRPLEILARIAGLLGELEDMPGEPEKPKVLNLSQLSVEELTALKKLLKKADGTEKP